MREYQGKRNNPYILPHNLYMRMVYMIRDYERMKNIAGKLKNCQIETEIEAVETALEKIPEFYRLPIYQNVVDGERYPVGADERTFRRYKQKFIYYVAKELRKI